MGAQDFTVEGAGKTALEAFTEAVKAAAYDYGHSGYTGSIAEKSSFTIIRDTPADVRRLEAKEKAKNGDAYSIDPWHAKDLDSPDPVTQKYGIAGALMDLGDPRIDDKWGPAGCIELEKGRWLFFGWASS